MELTKEWFIINSDKSDLYNVLFFIEKLPSNMEQIFDNKISNFQSTYLTNETITKQLFLSAYKEAKIELESSLKKIRDNENVDKSILKQIGFSKNSLKLKAVILNQLWQNILSHFYNIQNRIIDFTENKTVSLFQKFLAYLNSLLGSLLTLVPGVEPMKEFKEIIESFLSIAEE